MDRWVHYWIRKLSVFLLVDSETVKRQSSNDEITLHCDEKSNDLMSSDESKQHSPVQEHTARPCFKNTADDHFSTTNETVVNLQGNNTHSLHSIGQLVWVQVPGYPPWPGKVITSTEAKKPELENGKVNNRVN